MESTLTRQLKQPPFFEDFFQLNAWASFVLANLLYFLVLIVTQQYIMTDDFFYQSLGEQLTIERIDEVLEVQKDWLWLSYLIIPLTVFLQALFVTLCLNTGTILYDYRIKFSEIFGIAMKAILVFALAKIMTTTVLLFSDVQQTDDFIKTDWFTLLGYLNFENIPQWLQYPISIINIWEILFVFVLSTGLSVTLNKKYAETLSFVFLTYGFGLLIWVLFVTFLQLNFT